MSAHELEGELIGLSLSGGGSGSNPISPRTIKRPTNPVATCLDTVRPGGLFGSSKSAGSTDEAHAPGVACKRARLSSGSGLLWSSTPSNPPAAGLSTAAVPLPGVPMPVQQQQQQQQQQQCTHVGTPPMSSSPSYTSPLLTLGVPLLSESPFASRRSSLCGSTAPSNVPSNGPSQKASPVHRCSFSTRQPRDAVEPRPILAFGVSGSNAAAAPSPPPPAYRDFATTPSFGSWRGFPPGGSGASGGGDDADVGDASGAPPPATGGMHLGGVSTSALLTHPSGSPAVPRFANTLPSTLAPIPRGGGGGVGGLGALSPQADLFPPPPPLQQPQYQHQYAPPPQQRSGAGFSIESSPVALATNSMNHSLRLGPPLPTPFGTGSTLLPPSLVGATVGGGSGSGGGGGGGAGGMPFGAQWGGIGSSSDGAATAAAFRGSSPQLVSFGGPHPSFISAPARDYSQEMA